MSAISNYYDSLTNKFINNCPTLSRLSGTISKTSLVGAGVLLLLGLAFMGMVVASNPSISLSQYSGTQICFLSSYLGTSGILFIVHLFLIQ
jgi:hypothetical protein